MDGCRKCGAREERAKKEKKERLSVKQTLFIISIPFKEKGWKGRINQVHAVFAWDRSKGRYRILRERL